jgi:autotransporter-associated beta strand protein
MHKNITVNENSTISAKNMQFLNTMTLPTVTVAAGKTVNVTGFFENFAKAAGSNRPLAKAGDGTMILAGANTYTGATTLNGGTLLVNGSLSASSAVTAVAGTTLGGTGTAAGTVTVNASAFLAPGDNGAGTLTTGNLTLTGTYQCQVDGANTDKIAANGVLNLTGSTLSVSTIGSAVSGTYVIATATSGITGTFGAALPSGYSLDYGTPNQVKLVVVAATSGYDSWLGDFTFALGDDTTRTGDPDGDGFTNLQEFLFGTDPTANNGALTTTEKSGGDLIIRWKQRTSGATYALKESATLANPWVTSIAPISNDGATSGDYQPKMATVTMGAGKDFFRVEGVEN